MADLFGNDDEDEDEDDDEDEDEDGIALMPWRFFQKTMAARAFGGEGAEKPAERQASVLGNPVETFDAGETLAEFPGIDGAGGDAQIGGDMFQWKMALAPPRFEDGCKVVADVAPES